MNCKEISNAKNPLLPASLAAIERAAQLARRVAIQTNTGIVIVKDKKIIMLSAQTLRQNAMPENNS